MIGVPCFIGETGGQHHQVPSTLIPGTRTNKVVPFVAETELVLGVEVEPFWQIPDLVVQREYQTELSSSSCASVHSKTLH